MSRDSFYGNKLQKMVYQNGLDQIVKKPTWATQISATIIDLIITDNKNIQHKVHMTPKISDHCILSVHIGRVNKSRNSEKIYERSFKNYNKFTIQEQLRGTPWNNDEVDVNNLAALYTKSITHILDESCPMIEFEIPVKYLSNKWINQDIINRIKIRDTTYKRAVFTGDDVE
ncbi:hypothetical protein HHI36_023566 [Cryptolaemus montrouzieri]|uniref:Uncharacterized protein n=1 Tax=Cryptolaemus montrouzieri TaxID=559131 RepID=A0ABD2PHF6_9CUCU